MRPIESSGPTGRRTSDGPRPPKWRRTRHRRAISLLEMVTVMWLVSVLLSLSVAYLHSLFSASQAAQQRLRNVSGLQRLAHTFRNDVHRASVAQPALDVKPSPDRLVLTLPAGRSVEYRAEVPGLSVVRRAGQTIEHRDTFALAKGTKVSLEAHFQEQPPTARLILHQRAGIKGQGRTRELVIDAVLGKDHRFVGNDQ